VSEIKTLKSLNRCVLTFIKFLFLVETTVIKRYKIIQSYIFM